MARVLAGGKEDLFDLYPAVLSFLRKQLRPELKDAAEDLAQDTMLACVRTFRQPDIAAEIRSPALYALGIARNKFQEFIRDGYKHGVTVTYDDDDAQIWSRVRQMTAEDSLTESDSRRRLRDALKVLDDTDRRLLELIFIDGLEHKTACRVLGLSAANGSRRKYQALRQLRFGYRGDQRLARHLPR